MKKGIQYAGQAAALAMLVLMPAVAQNQRETGAPNQNQMGVPNQSQTGEPDPSQTAVPKETGTANRLTSPDSSWAMKAAQGGMAEVKLGRLAQDNASSQAVKDFGQKMVDDHSKANDELKQVASSKGIALPSSISAKDQATYDRLSKLKGSAFDRAYMTQMVKDHRTDIAEFKREASHGSDADLKSFAQKTEPTLEQHLQLAEKTEAQVKK
ncbi:MAG TPA: DUF4142 domain-containing protein [Bryobacteraceae bacterium]|nr:DUF4142 domain-containing protein [Bryobacteraceae bacterium]